MKRNENRVLSRTGARELTRRNWLASVPAGLSSPTSLHSTRKPARGTVTAEEDPMQKKTKRVLGRTGARELTEEEVQNMVGGAHTETMCSFDPITKQPDGDVGECG